MELFETDEDGRYNPHVPSLTAIQDYLWGKYLQHIKRVAEIASGDPIVLLHVGDVTQGNKHRDEAMSSRMADQLIIAKSNLEPWYELPNLEFVRLAAGTPAHDFGEASAEIAVATFLDSSYDIDTRALYHGLAYIDGVSVDYAHHGPTVGKREWLKANDARWYLQDIMQAHIMRGMNPPDLVVRGHFHEWARAQWIISVDEKEYESMLLVLPSYQGISSYARKATRSAWRSVFGMAAIEIYDGAILRVHKITETKDIRTKEVLYSHE